MANIVYSIVLLLIRVYKIFEKSFMRLFRDRIESIVKYRFGKAGITVNGSNSYDIKLHNKEFYTRLACDSTLGMGESYMEGWWDCDDIHEFSYRCFSSELYKKYMSKMNVFVNYLLLHVFNLQTKARAFEVGLKHYDMGNDLFEAFLDPTMNYSCGYFKDTEDLNQAQINKMELIAQKLKLEPGMKVLDIGCGWGSLAKYLAENYQVQVVGCTISAEGAKTAQERCSNLPVEIRVVDYRDMTEKFDRIVSVGMFEHVGTSNYRTFFEVVHKCLEEDGIFLLHSIGVNHKKVPLTEPWFHTYIFPNGILPYYKDIPNGIEDLFVIEDWHNFGYDYYKTLMRWHANFVKNWPKMLKYKGEKFYRMWTYYLLMSAGAFRSRRYQLWQVVLTKNGYKGGYQAVR